MCVCMSACMCVNVGMYMYMCVCVRTRVLSEIRTLVGKLDWCDAIDKNGDDHHRNLAEGHVVCKVRAVLAKALELRPSQRVLCVRVCVCVCVRMCV